MKYYELTCLISPDFKEEELKDYQEKITSLIVKEEGILDKVKSFGKKKLAYPIKKKETAYLSTISFYLSPQKIVNLEKKIKREAEILRYLILAKKISEIKKAPQISLPTAKKMEKPKKVELKDIEKKLKEILGE
jgi:small subunit ribosomal protein S6